MVKDGNGDDDEEGVMGVLPPPVARRVERLKCLNTGRERVMEKYLEERAALEKKIFGSMQASIRGKRKRRRQTFE